MADKLGRSRKAHSRSWGKIENRGKGKSGPYRASYVQFQKRYYAPSTFKTKREAEIWLGQQRVAIEEGSWNPGTPIVRREVMENRAVILRDYGAKVIEGRLTSKCEPLAASTKQGYYSNLRMLGDGILSLSLGELQNSPDVIEQWYIERLSQGKKTSTSHAFILLRTVMAQAVKEGLVEENPCHDNKTGELLIRGATSIRTNKKAGLQLVTRSQLDIIENAMPQNMRIIVTIAAWSALRFGELTELRAKDLSDDGEIITIKVRRSVTHVKGGKCVVKLGTKTGSKGIRDVELPPAISTQLRNYLKTINKNDDDALLFPSKSSCHHTWGAMARWWYPARKAAGCEKVTWHDLRHFGLTEYARIPGVTLKDLMERGGHTKVETAMRYQHAATQDQRKNHVRQMALTQL